MKNLVSVAFLFLFGSSVSAQFSLPKNENIDLRLDLAKSVANGHIELRTVYSTLGKTYLFPAVSIGDYDENYLSGFIDGNKAVIVFRSYTDGKWNAMNALPVETHLGADLENRIYCTPYFIHADSIQVGLEIKEGGTASAVRLRRFVPNRAEGAQIYPGITPSEEFAIQNQGSCEPAIILGRSSWIGLTNCPNVPSPSPTTVTHAIVHHSVSPNGWSHNADVASIHDFHVCTNGWDDIGYNYLISYNPSTQFSFIFEGRFRGNFSEVVGAHFCGTNSNTSGICVMGNYQNTSINTNSPHFQSLVQLLCNKTCEWNIPPTGTAFHSPSGLTLNRISGHQDGCATECPGNSLYNLLPTLRSAVNNCVSPPPGNNEDITITNPTVSSSVVCSGDEITVTANQCYSGSIPDSSLPNFDLDYYLSTDCNLNSSDILLGGDISGLGSDDPCNAEDAVLTIPLNTSPGNYNILFVADADNEMNESNENNNTACIAITIQSCSLNQDITITNPTVSTSSACPNDEIVVTANQCYSGSVLDADLPSFDLDYYLSADCNLNSSDILLGGDQSGLGSDDPCNAEDAVLTIPANTLPGNYNILFVADADNELTETNENNNTACIAITIQNCAVLPNITLNNPSVSQAEVCPGVNITASVEQCYSGSTLSNQLQDVGLIYYLSMDTFLDGSDIQLDGDASNVGSDIPCSNESELNTIPANTVPGTYYILFVGDALNSVNESNENDNVVWAQFTVLDCSPPCDSPLNLLASSITQSSVNLSWPAVPNAINYTVERRVCNTSQWMSLGTPATTSITWSTVECGTCYEWRVRTNCASGSSGFTSSSFNTPSCGCIGIQGCTNPTACNFNPIAQCDNGTCEFSSCLGCTIPNACNYDPTATINDGSCEFSSCAGCTDPAACNYDPSATISDGNCTYPDGCTDQTACNYDPNADCDNGTCEFISCSGCTNSTACNFDEDATIDDGSCLLPDGCTDETACNYDTNATCDDGSCTYPPALTINGLATVPQGLVTSYVSSPNIPGGQYTWNLNPSSYGTIDNPNATAIVVSYSEVLVGPGQMCVTVETSGSDNCSSSTCLDLNLVVGMEELALQPINVYPNPASDYLVIDVPAELGLVQTDLYNSIGQLIITQTTIGLHRMDISALSTGMYHCLVRTEQNHKTFKVQKH